MTPNLFVAIHTLVTPHKWFSHKKTRATSVAPIEHWDEPVPGRYEFNPGDGWYLVLADNPSDLHEHQHGLQKVVYSHILGRWLFETEYLKRQRRAPLPPGAPGSRTVSRATTRSTPVPTHATGSAPVSRSQSRASRRPAASRATSQESTATASGQKLVGFFRLDDGVTWVNDVDDRGRVVKGPMPRYVWDAAADSFRAMVKGDDPGRRASRPQSRTSLDPPGSRANSCFESARNSIASAHRQPISVSDLTLKVPAEGDAAAVGLVERRDETSDGAAKNS